MPRDDKEKTRVERLPDGTVRVVVPRPPRAPSVEPPPEEPAPPAESPAGPAETTVPEPVEEPEPAPTPVAPPVPAQEPVHVAEPEEPEQEEDEEEEEDVGEEEPPAPDEPAWEPHAPPQAEAAEPVVERVRVEDRGPASKALPAWARDVRSRFRGFRSRRGSGEEPRGPTPVTDPPETADEGPGPESVPAERDAEPAWAPAAVEPAAEADRQEPDEPEEEPVDIGHMEGPEPTILPDGPTAQEAEPVPVVEEELAAPHPRQRDTFAVIEYAPVAPEPQAVAPPPPSPQPVPAAAPPTPTPAEPAATPDAPPTKTRLLGMIPLRRGKKEQAPPVDVDVRVEGPKDKGGKLDVEVDEPVAAAVEAVPETKRRAFGLVRRKKDEAAPIPEAALPEPVSDQPAAIPAEEPAPKRRLLGFGRKAKDEASADEAAAAPAGPPAAEEPEEKRSRFAFGRKKKDEVGDGVAPPEEPPAAADEPASEKRRRFGLGRRENEDAAESGPVEAQTEAEPAPITTGEEKRGRFGLGRRRKEEAAGSAPRQDEAAPEPATTASEDGKRGRFAFGRKKKDATDEPPDPEVAELDAALAAELAKPAPPPPPPRKARRMERTKKRGASPALDEPPAPTPGATEAPRDPDEIKRRIEELRKQRGETQKD